MPNKSMSVRTIIVKRRWLFPSDVINIVALWLCSGTSPSFHEDNVGRADLPALSCNVRDMESSSDTHQNKMSFSIVKS